ncbi:hypothetical protein Tco_0846968 [Tanacetum coccineum]
MERRQLWTELGLHKHLVRGHLWILMGDFNVSLNMEDSFSGSLVMDSVMCNFKDCVNNIEVFDINSFGLHFTWNQKPKGRDGVLKKLDRIMGNIDFVDVYLGAYAIFQPYRISDHSSCVLKIPSLSASKPKPFKGNLHKRVIRLRNELDEVQKALDRDPANSELMDEEAVYVQAFNNARLDEERFLRQKAKIEWLEVGDSNSAYFHKSIKSRNQRSRIDVITTSDNVEVTGIMAMFGIGDDKAPSPDGFTSVFFKKGWDVVGQEVCNAVRDFFVNGKLLKEINHTFLALIPKTTTPLKVNDYRPISCCNVIYKCISKILTNRIIEGIKEAVSENQSAFVSGRRISDNILITQELMHNYHLDRGHPRCAFKVDIQKAYDTVWNLVRIYAEMDTVRPLLHEITGCSKELEDLRRKLET